MNVTAISNWPILCATPALTALHDLRLRNCLDDNLIDSSFELKSGSSNISSLIVIKSTIAARDWKILAAGFRRLRTVRYSVQIYDDPSEEGYFTAFTVTLVDLVSALQMHRLSIETLELNYGALDHRASNKKHWHLGAELQSLPAYLDLE